MFTTRKKMQRNQNAVLMLQECECCNRTCANDEKKNNKKELVKEGQSKINEPAQHGSGEKCEDAMYIGNGHP